MTRGSHLGSQGEAGSGVHRLRECVDQLLYVFDVGLLAVVKVFKVDAGKAVGVFQATKEGSVLQ